MIVACERATAPNERAAEPANPLRPRGEVVVCPRCEREGTAWEWELKRAPRYAAWTVPCFRCKGCGHVFGVVPPTVEDGAA